MPRKKTGIAILDKRLADLDAAGGEDDGTQRVSMQERGVDYPAAVHTAPAKTKIFSDGSVRTWDDTKQTWVVVSKSTTTGGK